MTETARDEDVVREACEYADNMDTLTPEQSALTTTPGEPRKHGLVHHPDCIVDGDEWCHAHCPIQVATPGELRVNGKLNDGHQHDLGRCLPMHEDGSYADAVDDEDGAPSTGERTER